MLLWTSRPSSTGRTAHPWLSVETVLRNEGVRTHVLLPPRAHGIAAALRTWESAVIELQLAKSLGPLLTTTVDRL
ncbi:hypothetical protein SAMN05518866_1511 [Sphingobium sp. YR768]|nr:hypothetical protein SAMN05518866_1511 [Sphingobium sp. YR768]